MKPIPLALVLLLCAGPAGADTWPSFRGAGAEQSSTLPVEWSGKENLAWKAPLPGYGQSSPVVWKGTVFLTSVKGKEKEKCIVAALDVGSGKRLWEKSFDASQKGKNNPSVSRAAPTPVADRDGLYVFFETGDLLGLGHGGEVKWRRSLTKDHGEFKNHHGLASSLAQSDGAVYVLVEHAGPSYLLAVDKATGKDLWKAERPKGMSWASPVVAVQGGKPVILVSSNGSLAAYRPEDGKELWKLGDLYGNLIPSPVVAGELVVLGAGESGLSSDMRKAAASNCCVRLTGTQDEPACEVVWRGKKAVCHHASPVVHRGCVYVIDKTGVLHCLDLKTGEERYTKRLAPCWATPLAAGDYLYLFGKDGVTRVIKAGPKFESVATNRLWTEGDLKAAAEAASRLPEHQFPPLPPQGREQMEEMLRDAVGEVVYGVAAAGGAFFIRTGTDLFCVRERR